MVYTCPVCNRVLNSKKSIKAHEMSKVHLKAVAAQELVKLEAVRSDLTKLINTYKKIDKKPTVSVNANYQVLVSLISV